MRGIVDETVLSTGTDQHAAARGVGEVALLAAGYRGVRASLAPGLEFLMPDKPEIFDAIPASS